MPVAANSQPKAARPTQAKNPAVAGGVFVFGTRGPTLPPKGDELVGDELCPWLHSCGAGQSTSPSVSAKR